MPAECGNLGADLRAQQTSFRDQGGRDTCTTFAATAAVEAAYKRIHGLDLDLSEQFLHHVQKSHRLENLALPLAEIPSETWGGGNIPWQMEVLGLYGIPLEQTLPYIRARSWQEIQDWTSPRAAGWAADQRALDDFMLSAVPVEYSTPTAITATVLPQGALENARYRPTSVKLAPGGELRNLGWYKSELAAGREVAFDVRLSSRPSGTDDVWSPGTGNVGDHAMLMVGFDDVRRAFWVKNSWNEGRFLLFSYDWVTNGAVSGAATILDVADPHAPFGTQENKHLFLGRWNLDHDGWQGTLDIYRLPGDESKWEHRLGTYFGPDGVARRVNGKVTGNRLEFFMDWNTPDLPPTAMAGMHFVTYLYSTAHSSMAGYMIDTNGNRWSVTAQKGGWVTGVPRASAALGPAAYVGRWNLITDGARGTLALQASANGDLSGTFTAPNGPPVSVTGKVLADPRMFTLTIDGGIAAASYTGYLNGRSRGIMAGSVAKSGGTFGFHASRTGDL